MSVLLRKGVDYDQNATQLKFEADGLVAIAGDLVPSQMQAMGEPTGFVDRSSSTVAAVIDGGNIKFTITGTDFQIYSKGVLYLKSTEIYTITSPVAGVLYYLYYDGATPATLPITHGTDFWDLSEDVPIITAYYDGASVLVGDERHGISMDWSTHAYLHMTVGTRYANGLAGTFATSTLSITEGDLWDEDIDIEIPLTTTCRVMYRSGGHFFADVEGTLYYKSPAGVLKYDNAGSLASVTNNYHIAAWIFGTNDPDSPIYALVGQREDQKIADARSNNTYESLSLGTLPFAEYKALFRIILKNNGGTPTYIETQDLRSISNLPAGTYVATDINATTGNLPETRISFSDNTIGDVSITEHGYVPKAPNDKESVLRGDGTWSAMLLLSGIAGESLAQYDLCYQESTGKYWKANATSEAKMPGLVMASEAISAEATGDFIRRGIVTNISWSWNIGGTAAYLYASALTAGAITQTAPDASGNQLQIVGVARSATIIDFDPQLILVEIA